MLTPRRLIITDGSLPALAALALQDRPDQAVFWVPVLTLPAVPSRLGAIGRQAGHFKVDQTIGPGAATSRNPSAHPPGATTALDEAHLLLAALLAARDARCGRIIWPCQAGLDLDRIAQVHEVVMSAAHLAQLDATAAEPAPEIRTPLLDCTDSQVIDLINRSGVPTSLAWWCEHDAPRPCGGCESCRRWDGVLHATAAA